MCVYSIGCEPETVRDNFDYFSYGNEENALKNLDLHDVSGFIISIQIYSLQRYEARHFPNDKLFFNTYVYKKSM